MASLTVRRLAEAAGYVVRPSQTGRLNQIVIDMWGGLEAAAEDLSGPVRKLLDVLTPASDMKDELGPTRNYSVDHHAVIYRTRRVNELIEQH